MSFDIAVADTYHESSVHDKSYNYSFIYFVRQYCCLTLNVKDEIFKISWTSFYRNGIYVLKTKHTCTMSLFISDIVG